MCSKKYTRSYKDKINVSADTFNQHKEFTLNNKVEKIHKKTLRVEFEELRKELRALKNPSPWGFFRIE